MDLHKLVASLPPKQVRRLEKLCTKRRIECDTAKHDELQRRREQKKDEQMLRNVFRLVAAGKHHGGEMEKWFVKKADPQVLWVRRDGDGFETTYVTGWLKRNNCEYMIGDSGNRQWRSCKVAGVEFKRLDKIFAVVLFEEILKEFNAGQWSEDTILESLYRLIHVEGGDDFYNTEY